MADVLSFRLKQRPVRLAASIATLFVSLFYLIAQMAGAAPCPVLLDIHETRSRPSSSPSSVPSATPVLIGGMKGTTYVQMIAPCCAPVCSSRLSSSWSPTTATSPSCSTKQSRLTRSLRTENPEGILRAPVCSTAVP